ncbi:MAG: hypothetical protein U0359_16360 [Byssovorax sp.]
MSAFLRPSERLVAFAGAGDRASRAPCVGRGAREPGAQARERRGVRVDPPAGPCRGLAAGTIADQLDRHHDTIERVLAHSGLPVGKQIERTRKVDSYLPFIEETLAKYPRLRASRSCGHG